jgi:hypothetical protein
MPTLIFLFGLRVLTLNSSAGGVAYGATGTFGNLKLRSIANGTAGAVGDLYLGSIAYRAACTTPAGGETT